MTGGHLTVRCLPCRLKEPDVQVACRNALHPLLLSLTSHSAACSSRLARSAQALLYKAGGLYASMLRRLLQALLDFVSHGTWGSLCTVAFLWMCCLYVAACCYSLSRQTADKIETVVRLCGEPGVHRGDTSGLAVRSPPSGWLSRGHTHNQFVLCSPCLCWCTRRAAAAQVLPPGVLKDQSGLLPVRLAGRCCLHESAAACCLWLLCAPCAHKVPQGCCMFGSRLSGAPSAACILTRGWSGWPSSGPVQAQQGGAPALEMWLRSLVLPLQALQGRSAEFSTMPSWRACPSLCSATSSTPCKMGSSTSSSAPSSRRASSGA